MTLHTLRDPSGRGLVIGDVRFRRDVSGRRAVGSVVGAFVLWCGPVSASNISGVPWPPDTDVLTVNHGTDDGIGSGSFASLGASLGPHPLEQLMAQHGIEPTGKIAIMGFSAAHGLLAAILNSADAGKVDALGAFDAYFTGPGAPIKAGYLAHCQRAAAGDALAVVTTSANGGNLPDGTPYPPGNEAFRKVADAVGGLSSVAPPAGVPAPVVTLGRGGFWWADYQGQGGVSHTINATEYARAWSTSVIAPYLGGANVQATAGGRARKVLKAAAIAGAALALAAGAFVLVEKQG